MRHSPGPAAPIGVFASARSFGFALTGAACRPYLAFGHQPHEARVARVRPQQLLPFCGTTPASALVGSRVNDQSYRTNSRAPGSGACRVTALYNTDHAPISLPLFTDGGLRGRSGIPAPGSLNILHQVVHRRQRIAHHRLPSRFHEAGIPVPGSQHRLWHCGAAEFGAVIARYEQEEMPKRTRIPSNWFG